MTVSPPDQLTLDRIETPIGTALVATDQEGVLRAFNWTEYEEAFARWVARCYPRTRLVEGRGPLRRAFEAYFAGEIGALSQLRWSAVGTAFQGQVWSALCDVAPGATLSYGGLAQRIGRPAAVRAVGLANGANPVALVVPCHRVIGSNGTLTGYGGGLHRKRWLLKHEGAAFRDTVA